MFQEVNPFNAADAGTYVFSFDTQVPGALEGATTVFAFVKLLDPNAGFADVFGGSKTFDTAAAGPGSIEVTLTAEHAGMILQWGFTSKSSNYEFSGRWYDNVRFGQRIMPGPGPLLPVPIPFWAYLLMGGLIAGFGISRMRARQ